eukprot:1503296-Rhodomonas_salina.1
MDGRPTRAVVMGCEKADAGGRKTRKEGHAKKKGAEERRGRKVRKKGEDEKVRKRGGEERWGRKVRRSGTWCAK